MNLPAIRALIDAATPGPWSYNDLSSAIRCPNGKLLTSFVTSKNGEYIIAMRNNAEKMLAVCEAAKPILEAIDAEREILALPVYPLAEGLRIAFAALEQDNE